MICRKLILPKVRDYCFKIEGLAFVYLIRKLEVGYF